MTALSSQEILDEWSKDDSDEEPQLRHQEVQEQQQRQETRQEIRQETGQETRQEGKPEHRQDAEQAEPTELQKALAALEKLTGIVTKIEADQRATAGRVGSLQSAIAKAEKSREAPVLPKTPDKWNAQKQDLPELAEATEEFIESKLAALRKIDPEEFVAVKETVDKLLEKNTSLEIALVETKHPGWVEKVNTDEFKTWRAAQPLEVQALAQSSEPKDAVRMLDLFDAWKTAQPNPAQIAQVRKNRLDQSATVRGTAGTRTMKSIDEMTAKELWDLDDDDPRLKRR